MKIKTLFAALLLSEAAMAGGLLTNTNQSAAFIRQMSQNATIDITSLYTNPAGTAFLSDGWHLSLNVQNAKQTREIQTTFPLFALNNADHSTTHDFKGEALAPVIPSFQVSYNKDKWSVNAAFAITGGGGKCEFDRGLGTFEALYAGQLYQQVPAAVRAMVMETAGATLPTMIMGQVATGLMGMGIPEDYARMIATTTNTTYGSIASITGYNLNSYLKGRQYYFGLTLGTTYKFQDNLAGYIGLRGVYATCNYNGYVQDVKADYSYLLEYKYDVPANANLGFPGLQGEGSSADKGTLDLSSNTLALNCDQTGFGITPIIGIDWKINNQWNIAAKYEFQTHIMLKNTSEMNDFAKAQAASNETLGQFADGGEVEEDVPAIFAVGVQYSPVPAVRLNAGANIYFDKNAGKYGDKQKLIDDNTLEFTAGAEWDINKYITVSGSWQNTSYGLSDAYMNDLSFNLSSNSIGAGIRINATKRCSIDLGYMQTLYKERTVTMPTAAGNKVDTYNRTNRVLAAGVNLAF